MRKMQFSVLASGSKGNCTYVEKDGRGFLIDAGLSGKKITERLAKIGRSMDQVEGILVTHEHTDHIQGVGVLSRKHHVPIYANEKRGKRCVRRLETYRPTTNIDWSRSNI